MMKKVGCFCMLFFFFCCGSYATTYPAGIAHIVQRGSIIVALPSFNYPPLWNEDKDGNLHGLDVDIARDMAKSFGVKLLFDRKPKTFNDAIEAVIIGEADIGICNLSETLSRAKRISYSNPYLMMNLALLVNRAWSAREKNLLHKRHIVDVFKDGSGVIGVFAGSSYEQDAHRLFPQATIKPFTNFQQELNAVLHGKVGAILHDELQIKRFLLAHPDAALQLKAILLHGNPDQIGMAVSYSHRALLHWVNLYLQLKGIKMSADDVLKTTKAHR